MCVRSMARIQSENKTRGFDEGGGSVHIVQNNHNIKWCRPSRIERLAGANLSGNVHRSPDSVGASADNRGVDGSLFHIDASDRNGLRC